MVSLARLGLLFCFLPAAASWSAEIVDLCGTWSFAYAPSHTGQMPDRSDFRTTIEAPGCWDDHFDQARARTLWKDARFNPHRGVKYPMDDRPPDASLPYLLGAGWYLRTLDVPERWRGRQVTLRVGRVVMEAWVYVNGRPIHHHVGHSTPWEAPLDPHLRFGQGNELAIAVANTFAGQIGCDIRGWKGRSGGIFGPVSIKIAGPARIADLFVFARDNKLQWQVELAGETPPQARLTWKAVDPKSNRTFGEGTRSVAGRSLHWTTNTLGIPSWSDHAPNLVDLQLALQAGEDRLDEHRQPFGLRQLSREGTQLRLNERPICLRGVCDCCFFPKTCTPPLDVESYRRHVRRLKEAGFNWIRCHTWTPTEPYLQAADELGIMFQVEPPAGYNMEQWRDILRFCRTHPSVAIYCCGNEELLDEPKIDFLSQCAAAMREEAPDALFSPQEALGGVEYRLSGSDPGTTRTPFLHHGGRLAKLQQFSDLFGNFSWGQLSYTSLKGGHEEIDARLEVYRRPCLSHEVGIIGSYLDLDLEPRYRGTRIGTDLHAGLRQALQRAGLLDRARLYHRHSAAWQRLLRKDVIEMTRRCRLLSGYNFLGANDSHWHRTGYGCGLLNEFDEWKAGESAADVLRYNGESVLLIDRQRERILAAGQWVARDLLVSWFGRGALENAVVQWRLATPAGALLAQGQQPADRVEPGTVRKIGAVRFTAPQLNQPTKATLAVRLAAGGRQLDNEWDYWIFPAPPVAPRSDVAVVEELSESVLEKLADGARVVLIGCKPLPSAATSFQMALAGRPQGNLATVIADHPLLAGFPHDGYCDWQFSNLLNARAVVFDSLPAAFDPILEVVSSYKQIRKQAAVFQWRVGRGRLLACTLNLSSTDPAAAYFRWRLLDYAASDKFHPKTDVAPDVLAKLVKGAPSGDAP